MLRASEKLQELALRVALLVGALFFALIGRYGSNILIPEALGIVLIFSIAYILVSIFLTKRHYNPFGDHLFTALMAVAIVYGLAILIIFVTRGYYSLGFVAIFIVITIVGTLAIEYWKALMYSRCKFFLVSQKVDCEQVNHPRCAGIISEPSRLAKLDPESLVSVDYESGLEGDWQREIANFGGRGGRISDSREVEESDTGRVSPSRWDDDLKMVQQAVVRYAMTKRVLDYVISVAALLFLAVPMVIVGILISLTSVGAPIYRQPRVGLHGEIFTILKFRTMLNKEDGETKFTSPTDRRVTAVGRILRRWRIDEWPQFINVLKGEMSIVGPRPEQIGWVEIYNEEVPFFNLRHSVRPGITGWAQIHHGYTSTTDAATKKTEYDLYYIKYLSLSLDLTIMVQTLIVLFSGKGSR